jgi:hypothetical protein
MESIFTKLAGYLLNRLIIALFATVGGVPSK